MRQKEIKDKRGELDSEETSEEEETPSKDNRNDASRETHGVEGAGDHVDSRVVVEEDNNADKLEQAGVKLNTKRKGRDTSSLDAASKRSRHDPVDSDGVDKGEEEAAAKKKDTDDFWNTYLNKDPLPPSEPSSDEESIPRRPPMDSESQGGGTDELSGPVEDTTAEDE